MTKIMNKLSFHFLFIIGFSTLSYSQSYYNPSNRIDLNITIRESFKPIDWGKIGGDFNTMIVNELQRRENLKRYYDEIYYQTKNFIYSGTVLTSDNLINSKILMFQSEVIRQLDYYNKTLKNGLMKPNEYESNVRNIYYSYMNNNRIFLQIFQYKYNKDLQLVDTFEKEELNERYINTLNSITVFFTNVKTKIEFVLNGLNYSNYTLDYLYEFVSSSIDGSYDSYKNDWESEQKEKKIIKEKRIQDQIKRQKYEKERVLDLKNYRKLTFDKRKEILQTLDKRSLKKYRKVEKKFIISSLISSSYFNKSRMKMVKVWLKEENENFEFRKMMFDMDKKDGLGYDPVTRIRYHFIIKFCLNQINLFSESMNK